MVMALARTCSGDSPLFAAACSTKALSAPVRIRLFSSRYRVARPLRRTWLASAPCLAASAAKKLASSGSRRMVTLRRRAFAFRGRPIGTPFMSDRKAQAGSQETPHRTKRTEGDASRSAPGAPCGLGMGGCGDGDGGALHMRGVGDKPVISRGPRRSRYRVGHGGARENLRLYVLPRRSGPALRPCRGGVTPSLLLMERWRSGWRRGRVRRLPPRRAPRALRRATPKGTVGFPIRCRAKAPWR